MRRKNENKGITLITLVITIIILLILVGVTIATLTGDNGILGKGSKASEETEKETATEIINLKITEAQIASYAEKQQMPDLQYLADRLCEDLDNDIEYVELTTQKTANIEDEVPLKSIIVGEAKSIFTKLKQYPYEFEINGALKVASINGIQIADKNTDNSNNEELKAEIDNLKTEIASLKEGIEDLKNSAIMNQRVKLMSESVSISLPITNWEEGDFANIQLSDSIEKYKYLEIQFDYDDKALKLGRSNQNTMFIATEQLNYINNNDYTNATGSTFMLNQSTFGVWCWFKNDKLLHVAAIWNDNTNIQAIRIRSIYGIK